MTTSLTQSLINFHISLNVSDISRSVEFFSKVFGTEPVKHREDYAKFELQNPPVTFSLEPTPPSERGALNHVGFKLQSSAELVEFQRRLEMAGIHSEREEGVECCYATQTKFWLHDPDGTLWEMYILEGDLEYRGAGQDAKTVTGERLASETPAINDRISCSISQRQSKQQWAHRLGSPLVIPDEHPAESLDRITLQGTFNGEKTLSEINPFLKRVAERLKPGGQVSIHCLTADRHVSEPLKLSGPASVVKSVPCLDSLLDHLKEAGLEAISLKKYGSHACFTVGQAELRETLIEGTKPQTGDETVATVIYRGPFAEVKLDCGKTIQRGCRTILPRIVVEQLKTTMVGDSLVVIETATSPVSCSG